MNTTMPKTNIKLLTHSASHPMLQENCATADSSGISLLRITYGNPQSICLNIIKNTTSACLFATIHIRSVIYVARDSQKAIIIGKGGSAIKKLGMQARTDIEEFTGKKIFLELFVKVDKDWRDNEAELKRFGYEA